MENFKDKRHIYDLSQAHHLTEKTSAEPKKTLNEFHELNKPPSSIITDEIRDPVFPKIGQHNEIFKTEHGSGFRLIRLESQLSGPIPEPVGIGAVFKAVFSGKRDVSLVTEADIRHAVKRRHQAMIEYVQTLSTSVKNAADMKEAAYLILVADNRLRHKGIVNFEIIGAETSLLQLQVAVRDKALDEFKQQGVYTATSANVSETCRAAMQTLAILGTGEDSSAAIYVRTAAEKLLEQHERFQANHPALARIAERRLG